MGAAKLLDIDGWIQVGMPFENGVVDVTGCSQIGVVPFSVEKTKCIRIDSMLENRLMYIY